PFSDLDPNAYYYKAVLWAAENGVTQGRGDGTFGIFGKVTRGQFVTFLWRAAGSPEPKTQESPFPDLDPSAYYYKAVLWAAENGVTQGKDDGTFDPNGACTRAQIVAFLFRAYGK
ncbi:MAG: S-layer homology domain-containing protein, partial [Oscillibacter sp.]|nr:S-layer homology domain-containing protein [Oscillibacter sp.]